MRQGPTHYQDSGPPTRVQYSPVSDSIIVEFDHAPSRMTCDMGFLTLTPETTVSGTLILRDATAMVAAMVAAMREAGVDVSRLLG